MKILSKLIAGGVIVQILVAVSVMISSRLYKPEVFGELGWYLSFASVFAIVAAMRFDYIVLSDRVCSEEKNEFFSNAIVVSIITFFLLCIGVVIANNVFHFKYNIIYLLLFCLSLSFFNLLSQYLILIKDYNKFIFYKTNQLLLQIVMIVGFYYVFHENGLLLANILPQLIISILFFLFIRKSLSFKLNNFIPFFYKNYREGFKNSFLTFIQYSTPVIPVLFGGYVFDKSQIGAYFLFSQTMAVPFSLIRRNVLILFNGEYSDAKKIKELFESVLTARNFIIVLMSFACFLVFLVFCSSYIIMIFFGREWLEFSWLLSLLFIYYFFDALLQPLTTLYPLWGKVNKALGFELVRFASVAIVLPLVVFFAKLSFSSFVILFLIIMLLIYVVNFYSILMYVKRLK
jgi:O-antigen/teichoic acid export membrane protein